jgi:hypothetical protein
MRQNVSESIVVTRLELLHHASTHGDLEAWAAFRQSLEETVLTWLHDHPGSEAACRMQSEQYFVAQAFERLLQATVRGQVTCETLSEVLMFLRVSLNGAILEMLRDYKRPGAVSIPWPDEADQPDRSAVWNKLQARLPNRREQRLAYLLYHCGLEPAEIVYACPQEWGNFQEVIRLRRTILARFIQRPSCQAS